ncbi:N-acetylmuramoyl-L-alanine amidase [Lacticaseibacillus absianus]|uniref:N-acetylmuramoyl-L-alanine amidase n=1 Tax=Lacticaseibacillus absianus TaxID=2729623 RepID=UPI0015C73D18|nr:N-acetylmuramoyl-L-alanine amidase [Lacticaseibacillus absianus]
MHLRQLRRWPLIAAFAFLIGISLATTTVLANNDTLTVRASMLNVRLGPGLSYNAMGQVPSGTQLTVLGERNSWYQVRLAGNKIGWVASWLVDHNEATTDHAKVATTASTVNVRQTASTSAQILGSLSANTKVNVLYQENGWTEITYKNTAAWVATSMIKMTGQTVTLAAPQQTYLRKTPTPTTSAITVTTTITTNVRQAAGINAPVVTQVAKGATLTVLSQANDWYQVKTSTGKTGYVASWTVSTPGSKTAKAATTLAEATILLDPGHGGVDSGALSTGGKYEKTYTLQMAKVIGSALSAQGANVVYTRDSDKFVDLAPRAAESNTLHADAFISLHFDSTPNPNTASGFTTYYYTAATSKPLATAVNDALGRSLTLTNRKTAFANYQVLRDNKQPAILMEMGYINSDQDFTYISSPSYQQQVANAVVQGLQAYFKAGNHQ